MRKSLILIAILAILLCGCKERGEIEESHPELYYMRTDYYGQTFAVLHDNADQGNHRATITTDPELEDRPLIEAKPNTYVVVNLTDEEYSKITGDSEVFEGTLSLFTIVDPSDKAVYMYMVDIDTPTIEVLRRAASDENGIFQLEDEDYEPYMTRNRFNYQKL